MDKKKLDQVEQAKRKIWHISFFSACAIFILAIIGFIVQLNPTYAVTTPEEIPSNVETSKDVNDINIFKNVDSNNEKLLYIINVTPFESRNNDILYTTHRESGSFNTNYDNPVSMAITNYPGVTYILENKAIFNDYYNNNIIDVVSDQRVSEEEFLYYMTQVAIWWYMDIQDGFSSSNLDNSVDDNNYLQSSEDGTLISVGKDESNYYNRNHIYQFKNNLSVADKNTIRSSEYWTAFRNILSGALNYSSDQGTKTITINENNISYHIQDDALVTNDITVSSENNNFSSYTVTVSDERIKILNADSIETNTFTSQESFKLLIPYEIFIDNQASVEVQIKGTFMGKTSYVYHYSDIQPSYYSNDKVIVMPLSNSSSDEFRGIFILDKIYEDVAYDELSWNYNINLGEVTIHKIDAESRDNIEGAILVINDSLGNQIVNFETTNSNQVFRLPEGSYTITEVKTPPGYSVEKEVTDFSVEQGEVKEVVIENTRMMEVPNTASNNNYFYIIGGSMIILGIIILISLVIINKNKNFRNS